MMHEIWLAILAIAPGWPQDPLSAIAMVAIAMWCAILVWGSTL